MPVLRHWLPLSCAGILVAQPALAAPAPAVPTSQVAGVTVFPDRARVTRKLRMEVKPGARQAVFGALPADLDSESLRASGQGTALAAISGLEVRTVQLGAPPEGRTRDLERRIRGLDDQDRDLAAEIESHRLAQQALRAALANAGRVLGTALATGSFDPRQWLGPASLVSREDARLAKLILAAQRKQRELAGERDLLKRQLASLRGFQAKTAKAAVVFLDVTRAGRLDVTLTYDVPRAAWAPACDVTLGGDLGQARLAYHAKVTQQTGEDWQDTRVTLSSGRPDLGAAAPDLEEWFIGAEEPEEPE
ncbi:MAG: mucoidy inhibitor MuiA family protein, partial [Candidatus Sericytochromatia bacterium]|nr:mucoidy inhibitor MuiA family protein [Candidatus Tanganyikabacteria bacterium]